MHKVLEKKFNEIWELIETEIPRINTNCIGDNEINDQIKVRFYRQIRSKFIRKYKHYDRREITDKIYIKYIIDVHVIVEDGELWVQYIHHAWENTEDSYDGYKDKGYKEFIRHLGITNYDYGYNTRYSKGIYEKGQRLIKIVTKVNKMIAAYKLRKENEKYRKQRKFVGKLRQEILMRDNYTCQLCGSKPENGAQLHVDHIQPYSMGGLTVKENARTLCHECNIGIYHTEQKTG